MDADEVPDAAAGSPAREQAPGEQAPGEQAPGEQAPGEQAAREQAAREQAPRERVPQGAPGDQVPLDDRSPRVEGLFCGAMWQTASPSRGAAPQSAAALLGLLGGTRGMLDSAVPGALFVAVYVATRNLTTPLWIAVGAALAIFVYRLARRDALRYSVGGFVGVAVAAGLAVLTGKPENYFLPALALNVAYAVVAAVSLAVRWPLIGLVLGAVFGEGSEWRRDPARRRAYTAATLLWLCMFALRIAVLLPLWLANLLVPLGIGRIALGYPLYALVVWLTWLIISRMRPVRPEPAQVTEA